MSEQAVVVHDCWQAILVTLASIALFIIPEVTAAPDCNGRLVYVDDTSSVGNNYPLFMQTRRNLYVMEGDCFRLSGSEFRGSITFFVLSRAPEGFHGSCGVLMVKSLRTFKIKTQHQKIMVSRNDGWYLPSDTQHSTMTALPAINDVPIDTPIDSWNNLYANPKPPEFFEGLFARSQDVRWNAYPTKDRLFSPTDWGDFWKEDAGDFSKRVVTNYLLRFDVNPDKNSQNRVPFYVDTPKELEQVDLSVESNIGSLATTYTFLFD